MKKFSEMTNEEVIRVINESKELRDMLDENIQEREMDYVSDHLGCFDRKAIRYSISAWEPSYFNVLDDDLFLEGVQKSNHIFSLHRDTEKLLKRCEKLQGTNLFHYWIKKLAESYYETELKSLTDWIEDCSFELYQGSVGEKTEDYVELFVINVIGDYLWDSETKTYYKPVKVSA